MIPRPLGQTGLFVSPIGLGCWGMGGARPGSKAYGPENDPRSLATIDRALELGVNFFDTSDLYGLGHSEEVIGRALRGRRERAIIASKVGFVVDAQGRQSRDYSAAHIRRSLEGSLRRLQTDYLDLYQLHDPALTDLKADPGSIETLRELQAEGKIRAWGISLRSPADGHAAIEHFEAPVIQVNFNMIDQRALENGLLDLAGRRAVGVIARTPLCFGFLTGRYNADTRFPDGDHRVGWPREQIALWASAPELFAAALGRPAGQTPGQLALRYCLSYPAMSTVIPGMLAPAEVDENVAAAHLGPLTDAQRQAAEEVYRRHTFFLRKG
jgi:aryl-alcohol dehydrogenase-like predicted oxidoreductase